MLCGIYTINNILNGRVYVGSSVDTATRFRMHRRQLTKGYHHCKHLQRAWNKYGAEAFVFEVRLTCPKEELLSWEQMLLDGIDGPYNSLRTAGSCLGFEHTAETKAKLSAATKAQFSTPDARARASAATKAAVAKHEVRARMSAAAKARCATPEGRAHLVRAGKATHAKGYAHTKETLAKMSAAQIGRVFSAETRAKMSAAQKARQAKLKAQSKT